MSNMSMINEYARLCELNLKKESVIGQVINILALAVPAINLENPDARAHTHMSVIFICVYMNVRAYIYVYIEIESNKSQLELSGKIVNGILNKSPHSQELISHVEGL